MEYPSDKPFGFEYKHQGKRYAFSVVAASEIEAQDRAAAMGTAVLVGELRPATGATYDSHSCSSST